MKAVTGQCIDYQVLSKTLPVEGFDDVDRALYVHRHIAKLWKNQVALQGHTLPENYAAGRLSIVCDFAVSVPPAIVGSNEWVHDQPSGNLEFSARLIYSANPVNERNLYFGDQELVFIGNVELVQRPQGVCVPSAVRLYSCEQNVAECGSGITFQSAVDGILKLLFIPVNWELGVLVGLKNEKVHDVVKGASQVIEGVSGDKHQVLRDRLRALDFEDIASGIGIVVDLNGVRVSLVERAKLRLKLLDVLVGPFDF